MPADTAYMVKFWEQKNAYYVRPMCFDLVLLFCLEIMSVLVTSSLRMSNFTFLFILASFYYFRIFSSDLQEAKLIFIDLRFPFEMSLLHNREDFVY